MRVEAPRKQDPNDMRAEAPRYKADPNDMRGSAEQGTDPKDKRAEAPKKQDAWQVPGAIDRELQSTKPGSSGFCLFYHYFSRVPSFGVAIQLSLPPQQSLPDVCLRGSGAQD